MFSSGMHVDRFQIDHFVGRGGCGEVYCAGHRRLGTLHALKVIPTPTDRARARVLREGRLQASLRHPAVVAVTDLFPMDDAAVLVADFVRGGDLAAWSRSRPQSLSHVVHLLRDIAAALGGAHAAGIVHRDLKPSNVLIEERGVGRPRARLTDFGIARALRGEEAVVLTDEGLVSGTPAYLAPEALEAAADIRPTVDVFAFGCLAYELICGQRPFPVRPMRERARAIAQGASPVRDHVPQLPSWLAGLVDRCIAGDPALRPPDGAALVAALGMSGPAGIDGTTAGRLQAAGLPQDTRATPPRFARG